MKKMIGKVFAFMALKLPGIDKCIMLESVPDMSDNTRAVFDELIARGFNKKYKIIWRVSDAKKGFPVIKNVIYLDQNTMVNRFLLRWYYRRAKCLICCNECLPKNRAEQKVIYLGHGSPIKSTRLHLILPEFIDYCMVAGPAMVDITEYECSVAKEKIVSMGFPRNDDLFLKNVDLKKIFTQKDFDKVVVWYPTFRQHKKGHYNVTKNALPIINDDRKAIELNEYAKKHKVLIVLKPHFVQDVSYIKDLKLSNIVFINDEFFLEHGIGSYEFVGSCDALITDYSSIYFDYMLCDNPIALIWEDYEEYKRNPGFAIGVDKLLNGGEKVYTLDELKSFLKNVACEIDVLKEERNNICEMVNYTMEPTNKRRTVDFLIEKAGL